MKTSRVCFPATPALATPALAMLALPAIALAVPPAPASGQSVLDRTPNLSAGWVTPPHQMQFNFLHRFRASDAPTRKVSNVPTFITTYSLFSRTIVGFQYSSNSDLVSRIPNEWELFGRWAPLAGDSDSPIEAAVTVGYNDAAQSGDGELSLGLPLGQLRLLGVARAFSDGYGAGESRFAVGGGATLQLNRYLALAGDITSLLDRADTEEIAWGAALQIAIPYTPHTLSLQVTNTNTATMQGASRGISDAQWGFEFTVPSDDGTSRAAAHAGRRGGGGAAPRRRRQHGYHRLAGHEVRRAAHESAARDTRRLGQPRRCGPYEHISYRCVELGLDSTGRVMGLDLR